MNPYTSDICKYCGSTIYTRFGQPHCSGDNLKDIKRIFDAVLDLEGEPFSFSSRLETLQENELTFDLFMSYWNHKRKDSECDIECIYTEMNLRDISPEPTEVPIPEPFTPLPDLIEVYIAEIMLGRELTIQERSGVENIPKISEAGDFFWAPLTWVTFPHSYMSTHKSDGLIKSLEPLVKIFEIEDIRGRYRSGRAKG